MRFMEKGVVFVFIILFLQTTFAQKNDEKTSPLIENKLTTSDSLSTDSDTLNLSPDAIRIKIMYGQLNPYKKKYASSLYALVDASPEDFITFWKSKFKNEYAIRLKTKRGILVADYINLLEISTRMVTMYTSIEQAENQTRVNVALEINKGIFVDSASYTEDYLKLKSFLHKSIRQYYVDYYNSVLRNLQDQYDALLREKQLLINEQNRISQSLIRNNQEASNARKDKLANTTIVMKSDSKIRLNEERSRVNNEKVMFLQTELTQLTANQDTAADYINQKLERMKEIEKEVKRATSDLEKADKSILNAEKSKNKAELKIAEADAKIEQEEQEIGMEQVSMEQKKSELDALEKKLVIKDNQINQVNRKIIRIY